MQAQQFSNNTTNPKMLFLNDPSFLKLGIGIKFDKNATAYDGYRLFVKEGIRTEKVKVDIATSNGWADFVFEKRYKLRSLAEVEAFIQKNKHLPDVPSEKQLQKEGLDLGEMQKIQMQKIEELTLYIIELEKRIKTLENSKTQK
ncbi:MAG: hypothetical protein EAZ85_09220 [Bacteroidetes bacterium]|nr:MAG: hypothetical protein EAZ85_09220 [Bacteroidota bacterium]TAG88267.1 MAG: hypothetical protein EAZ20_08875 [Bacteroidota bacterium]